MNANHRIQVLSGLLALALIPVTASRAAQPPTRSPQPTAESSPSINVLEVRPGVFMLVGRSSNAVVYVGDDAVLLVNTLSSAEKDAFRRKVDELARGQRIKYIVNTSGDPHHIGGNAEFNPREIPGALSPGNPVQIFAQENVYARMARPGPDAAPVAAWPTDPYPKIGTDVHINGSAVNIIQVPAAHTDGDSIVLLRSPDVLIAGDILLSSTYPVIDVARGGSIDGLIGALNKVLELTVTAFLQEGGTLVIPGTGRVSDESEVVEYRDMMVIIRGRIKDMMDRGMTLAQIQAQRPSFDYDTVYGTDQGPWTTAMFIESIYRSLGGK